MNNFGLSRSRRCDKDNFAVVPSTHLLDVPDNCPTVFEGFDALDAVCPVSSLTGNRMSIYEAMQMVGNEKYSRAIDKLLPEIPQIMSDSRLTDDDRISLMASRLDTGSASETARLRDSLAKIVSDFKNTYDDLQSQSVEKTVESVVEPNVKPNE